MDSVILALPLLLDETIRVKLHLLKTLCYLATENPQVLNILYLHALCRAYFIFVIRSINTSQLRSVGK